MNNVDVALFAATVAEESKESLTNAASCTTSVLTAIFTAIEGDQNHRIGFDLYALLCRRIGRGEYDGMRWEVDEDGIGRQLHIPQWGKVRSDKEHPSASDFYWVSGED